MGMPRDLPTREATTIVSMQVPVAGDPPSVFTPASNKARVLASVARVAALTAAVGVSRDDESPRRGVHRSHHYRVHGGSLGMQE